MKIFMLVDSMDVGGAETHVYELSRLLAMRGHRVTVLSSGGRIAGRLSCVGVRHLMLPSVSEMGGIPLALAALGKIFRREKPHIVHAHTRRMAFLCRLLLTTFDFPFVMTAHALFSRRFSFEAMPIFPNSTIAVSDDIAELLVDRFSVPREHISVVPNGIDVCRFAPRGQMEIDDGEPLRILTVSRLDKDCALAARLLCLSVPKIANLLGRAVQVTVVGDGTAFGEIRGLADKVNRRLGYSAVVLVGGRTDVERLLARCHIFVGVSRAALEAMATERPVILCGDQGYLGILSASNLAQARRTNYCARGFAVADAETLARDVVRLARLCPRERRELGQLGRDEVCRFYSAEKMTDATEQVYRREIARFRGARRSDALICGYYGYGNVGDELVLQSIADGQRALDPRVRLSVLTARGQDLGGARGVRRYDPVAVVREMRGTGAFLFGGGSLLQDSTSFRSLLYYLSLLALARWFGTPTMLYANGLGPLSPRAAWLCRKALVTVDVISLRDRTSYDTVCAMGVPRSRVLLGADPVLAEDLKRLLRSEVPYLAFFPKGRVSRDEERLLGRAVADLALSLGIGVVVSPMNADEDRATVERIADELRRAGVCRVTVGSSHPMAVEQVIGRSTLTVSERLHALILAFSYGVPAVGIDRDPKIAAFLQDVGAKASMVKPPALDLRAAAAQSKPSTERIRATLRRRAKRDAYVARRLIIRGS